MNCQGRKRGEGGGRNRKVARRRLMHLTPGGVRSRQEKTQQGKTFSKLMGVNFFLLLTNVFKIIPVKCCYVANFKHFKNFFVQNTGTGIFYSSICKSVSNQILFFAKTT